MARGSAARSYFLRPQVSSCVRRKPAMTRKPILKQFADLTPADFVRHPVSVSVHSLDYDEPWYDDADEETFRPWTGQLPVSPAEGMLLVRATLTLADGRTLPGFVTPQPDAEPPDLGLMQPQAFLPSGIRCDFWDGMFKRDPKERAVFYEELGHTPASIFPIAYAADSGLATGHRNGTIPGFCWRPRNAVKVYR